HAGLEADARICAGDENRFSCELRHDGNGAYMKIGVFGAGSIGCYLGGRLLAAGHDVVFVRRLRAEIADHRLTLTGSEGDRGHLTNVHSVRDAAPIANREAVLVTVKSMATEKAAATLAGVLPKAVLVVSFQNGVGNVGTLRAALPEHTVIPGMVPFNV